MHYGPNDVLAKAPSVLSVQYQGFPRERGFSEPRLWSGFCFRLVGSVLALRAAFMDRLLLDLRSHFPDLRASGMADFGGRQVAEARLVSAVVLVIDECLRCPRRGRWVESSKCPPSAQSDLLGCQTCQQSAAHPRHILWITTPIHPYPAVLR